MTAANMIKKKMSGKDFNPKQILGAPAEVREIALGVLMGVAETVSKTTSEQGEVLKGLSGKFIFKSNNKEQASDAAAFVFWPPSGCLGDVVTAVEGTKDSAGKTITEGVKTEFAFVVHVLRANNPAGYEWGFTPLLAPSEADPLEALQAKLAASGALALAPAEAAPALPPAGDVVDGTATKTKATSK